MSFVWPHLMSLCVDTCIRLQGYGIVSVLQHTTSLTRLSLAQCYRIRDEPFINIAQASSHALTDIDVTKCIHLTDRAIIALLTACPTLTSVCLASVAAITSASLAAMAMYGKNIVHVNLSGCPLLDDDGLVALTLSHCLRLQRMHLSGLVRLTGTSFGCIATCTSLLELDLSSCRMLTNDHVIEIAKGCVNLHRLSLSQCTAVEDIALYAISTHCLLLEALELVFCFKITDSGLCAIIRSCHQLGTLDVRACNGLTRSSFTCLAYHCPYLVRLVLGGCADSFHITEYVQLIRSTHPTCIIMNF